MIGVEIVAFLEAAGANIDKVVIAQESTFLLEDSTHTLSSLHYVDVHSLVKDIEALNGFLFVKDMVFIDENKIVLDGLFVSE
jgi:hypothetical protein